MMEKGFNVSTEEKLDESVEKLISSIQDTDLSIFHKKEAYPNYGQDIAIPAQRNLQRWLAAVRNIYTDEKNGSNRPQAVRRATNGWSVMEIYDFLNWIKFYQEGAHLKYKTAQLWYENGQPGYFLQIKQDAPPSEEPPVDHQKVDDVRDSVERQEEKKRIIEKQRQKIIGRLDSAEKLLRSPDGQMFAGPEMENLMESIYNLKKKVQLVNKLSTSTRLYEDMIIRESNVLRRSGFLKAADLLYSVAQANNPPPPGTGTPGPINELPPVDPPNDPSGAGHPGAPGGLPSLGPGMPQPPGSPPTTPSETQPNNPKGAPLPNSEISMGPEAPLPKGIEEFLEGTETANQTVLDNSHVDDLQVKDEEIIVVEAQNIPPVVQEDIPLTTKPSKPKPVLDTKPIEPVPTDVTNDVPPANEMGETNAPNRVKDFDRIIDSALSNVTITDVVEKLEDIAKIFKTREIPRQLSLVDMMLDSLGLASMFPNLSEAIGKSTEANNYVGTRLDEIISKLRGAMVSKKVDLKGDGDQPKASDVAQHLKEQDDKETARKKMRKEQENAELEGNVGKTSPQVDIGEDLSAPVAPAAPARPIG